MKKKFSLKDHLFNEEKVVYLASLILDSCPNFKHRDFIKNTLSGFPERELKDRISWITDNLERLLPKKYEDSVRIITKCLPPPLDPKKTDDDFGDFIFAPFGEYVVRRGSEKQYLQTSLKLLKELTKRFSMEFYIRPFLDTHQKETLGFLNECASDKNYHVRRLVSEGTRPKLPWAQKISLPYQKTIPLLTKLHKDPTRYVTRSVANHLNDISKINPDLTIKTIKNWKTLKQQNNKELEWITKHSLRSLIKKGDPAAMRLLGYNPKLEVSIKKFNISPKQIKIGDSFDFSFLITSKIPNNLLINYILTTPNKTKNRSSKTYKIKTVFLEKNTPILITKRHKLQKQATTYTLYPGKYRFEIQINGNIFGTKEFFVT